MTAPQGVLLEEIEKLAAFDPTRALQLLDMLAANAEGLGTDPVTQGFQGYVRVTRRQDRWWARRSWLML